VAQIGSGRSSGFPHTERDESPKKVSPQTEPGFSFCPGGPFIKKRLATGAIGSLVGGMLWCEMLGSNIFLEPRNR
jgi:hypothetical protein